MLKLQDRSGWSNKSTMLLRAKERMAKKHVIQSCNIVVHMYYCAEAKL